MANLYTSDLVKNLREIAKSADHNLACYLNESANRLEDHAEAFRRLAQALPGALNGEAFHDVVKAAIDLATRPRAEVTGDDAVRMIEAANNPPAPTPELVELMWRCNRSKPGSDLSIGTLLTLLHSQIRGMKSRREFSMVLTKLDEAEMWYRKGLAEIEMGQEAKECIKEEESFSIIDDVTALVQPIYRPGQRSGVIESLAAMFFFSGMPELDALNYVRLLVNIFRDKEDRSQACLSTYSNLLNRRSVSFPGLVEWGVSYEKYSQVFARLERIYGKT